jgi:hypothetical protein
MNFSQRSRVPAKSIPEMMIGWVAPAERIALTIA